MSARVILNPSRSTSLEDQSGHNRDQRFPTGFTRYEVKKLDSRTDVKVLTDNSQCCPPHIDAVVELEGRSYIVPHNPYEASYFVTAKQLKMLSEGNTILQCSLQLKDSFVNTTRGFG
jgi:hypothetical protein